MIKLKFVTNDWVVITTAKTCKPLYSDITIDLSHTHRMSSSLGVSTSNNASIDERSSNNLTAPLLSVINDDTSGVS